MMGMICLVQYKRPVEIDFKYSNERKCMMRLIHVVQDKSTVKIDFKYSNDFKCMMRDDLSGSGQESC
jgi:hypothetical protein